MCRAEEGWKVERGEGLLRAWRMVVREGGRYRRDLVRGVGGCRLDGRMNGAPCSCMSATLTLACLGAAPPLKS